MAFHERRGHTFVTHSEAPPRGSRSVWWVVLGVVWLVSAIYVRHGLDRGWFPHDEGMLAQAAERILGGELPHRDFDEVYTGGLSYLHAAAFRILGTNLLSLRLVLFGVFLLWVPALYYVATRFAQPAIAGPVVALAVAWSIPVYPAAVPSWYNLFLATFGVAALLRHLETGRRRWVFAAGVAGGLSCLAKVMGLYYVAGVLLYFTFREQGSLTGPGARPTGRALAYRVALGGALLCFVASLIWLVHARLAVMEVVHFVLPGAALAALVYRESARSSTDGWTRCVSLARLLGPFAIGVAIPIAAFVIPYARSGSLTPLATGVFVTSWRRVDLVAMSLPGPLTLFNAVPAAVLLGLVPLGRIPAPRVVLAIMMLTLVGFVVFSNHAVADTVRPLVPLAVLLGAWMLNRRAPEVPPLLRQQIMLLLSVTALVSLVQFPFATILYIFYVAPLAAVMVLALVQAQSRRPGPVQGLVLGLYLLFAVVSIHPSHKPMERLTLARAGIVVPEQDRVRYETLVGLLQAHASGGYTYAAPDCPEVYFLAGLRNPTRAIYEFLGDSVGRTQRVLRALDDRRVTAVAISLRPPFSGPLPPQLIDSLRARYSRADTLDRFEVRWRP